MKMHTVALGDYQTNCYFIWGEESETCVVIDPGFEPERVLDQAQSLGKRIEAILLTHGHFDHTGGVKTLVADTDCAVYVCPEDLSLPPQLTAGSLYYTHTYGEGDVLKLAGLTIRVMQTPGHTAGSVCLTVEDAMFSGDTLFANSCGRTDLPGGSWAEMKRSLKRLSQMETDYRVYPGHGQDTTLAQEKLYNPYLKGAL